MDNLWVRVNNTSNGGFQHVNLRHVYKLYVLPTIADPNKFTIALRSSIDQSMETLETGLWDNIDDANEALSIMTRGFDFSDRA